MAGSAFIFDFLVPSSQLKSRIFAMVERLSLLEGAGSMAVSAG